MTETTSQDPMAKLQAGIQSAQGKINSLQTGVRLTYLRDEIEDYETKTSLLQSKVAAVRTKGYVFGKDLENIAEKLRTQWMSISPKVIEQVNMQSNLLDIDLRSLEAVMQQLTARSMNVAGAMPFLNQVNAGISTLESKVSSTQETIKGMYDDFSQALTKMMADLTHLEWMLEQFSSATFQLLNTEAAVNAVNAVWEITGKEAKGDPKGLLYLTDQRLFFEQKEEIATKKILFITTEKEKIHKLLFEFPAVMVERMQTAKEGFFKNEDHIDLELASGAPFPVVHFHLDGQDCNEWLSQIGKVKGREYDMDRVVAIIAEEIEKVKKAPSQCPSCGGVINQPVLRGMDTLKCGYCGYVIRL